MKGLVGLSKCEWIACLSQRRHVNEVAPPGFEPGLWEPETNVLSDRPPHFTWKYKYWKLKSRRWATVKLIEAQPTAVLILKVLKLIHRLLGDCSTLTCYNKFIYLFILFIPNKQKDQKRPLILFKNIQNNVRVTWALLVKINIEQSFFLKQQPLVNKQ